MVSMRLAIAEDLTRLIILNKDDTDFKLSELLRDKEHYSNYIVRDFFKKNNNPVASQLGNM